LITRYFIRLSDNDSLVEKASEGKRNFTKNCAPTGKKCQTGRVENYVKSAPPLGYEERVAQVARRAEWAERRTILALCVAVLMLSSVLGINAAGYVYVPPFSSVNLPATCPSKVLFHRDCAGCGMTRSLISLGHGQWRAAQAYHPLGVAFYGFIWAQAVFQVVGLRRLKSGKPAGQSRFLKLYTAALVIGLVVTGIWRQL
jgi:hypothetical protein